MPKRPPLTDLSGQQCGRKSAVAGKAAKGAAAEAPPGTPPPVMSALHAPVRRGWGRDEWAAYQAKDSAYREKRTCPGLHEGPSFFGSESAYERWHEKYWDQYWPARNWGAPEEIMVAPKPPLSL